MPQDGTNRWGSFEKWSAVAFLVAGVLVSVATVALGLVLVTDRSQGMITGLPLMVGLLISYIGILGLYPRLANRARRAARAGVLLLLAPVVSLIAFLGYEFAVGGEPPFVGPLFLTVFVGFALGIVLFGTTSYRTEVPSRNVGLALLVFAIPWFLLIGSMSVYGGEGPAWLDFANTGLMAVALLAVGYFLWIEPPATNREESGTDPTARATPESRN